KLPEEMETAVLRAAIYQLGDFDDLRAPERQYPYRKLTASLHGRGRAALPPPRSREKDVLQFLHMRSLLSYDVILQLRLIRLIHLLNSSTLNTVRDSHPHGHRSLVLRHNDALAIYVQKL